MAIAFARMNIHTRSKGHSAVKGAAYRAGSKLFDVRTGETHDYTHRHDVAFHKIVLPSGVDKQFEHQEVLWNALEASEKRKDSQLAKDLQLALPRELNETQQIELALTFIDEHFTRYHIPVDVSIHNDHDGNPHAHLYFPMRRIYGDKFFTHKARDLNPVFKTGNSGKGFISETERLGEGWRLAQNKFFEAYDLDIVVDPNHLVPQKHEGRIESEPTHYLKETNRLQKKASIELGLDSPETIINHLSATFAVFSERDIQTLVFKTLSGIEGEFGSNLENAQAAVFQNLMAKILQSRDIIALGAGEDGRERYTTRGNFQRESRMQMQAEALRFKAEYCHHGVGADALKAAIANHNLSDEQREAVQYLTGSEGIACMVGRAGTGKTSYVLKTANAAWIQSGHRVIGTAISATAARGLKDNAGIDACTLDALYRRLLKGYLKLDPHDVVVMDEAGMTDLMRMTQVMNAVSDANAKLVLVGDPAQLQPVASGAPFRALLSVVGFCELKEIHRQQAKGDRQASMDLSQGRVSQALAYYDDLGHMVLLKTAEAAKGKLIQDWLAGFNPKQPERQIMLSFKNADIQSLNALARTQLKKTGYLKDERLFNQLPHVNALSCGERILFLKNHRALGVCNGDFATVTAVHPTKLCALLDSGKVVEFNPAEYQDFTYGYAATVHKSQGATFDNVFVHVGSSGWDRFLTYVALTRHRFCAKLYADEDNFTTKSELKTALGRSSFVDMVLDFPLSYALRRGFSEESLIGRCVNTLARAKAKIREPWQWVRHYEAYLLQKTRKQTLDLSKARREAARTVADFVDVHRALGKDWSSFMASVPAGVKAYQLPAYSDLYARMLIRNQLAHALYAKHEDYAIALEQNRVSLSDLDKWARSHETAERIAQYIRNDISGRRLPCQRLAAILYPDLKSHYGMLAHFASRQNLSVSALTRQLRLDYEDSETRRYLKALTGAEKADFKSGLRFVQLDRQVKATQKLLFDNKAFNLMSDTQRESYHQIKAARNQLGALLYAAPERFKAAIDLFNIKAHTLDKAAGEHTTRETVKQFYDAKGMALDYWAGYIKRDMGSYFGYLHEFDIDTKAIHLGQWRHARRLQAHGLSVEDKARLNILSRYHNLQRATAKAYAKVHVQNALTQQVDDKALKLAKAEQMAVRRNALAFQISQALADYEALKAFYKVDVSRIQVYAHQHQRLNFVKDYQMQTRPMHRAQMAAYLKLNMRAYYPAMQVAKLDMQRFQEDVVYHHYQQTLSELSSDQHRAYHLLLAYQAHQKAAGRAWYDYKSAAMGFNEADAASAATNFIKAPTLSSSASKQGLAPLLAQVEDQTRKQNALAYELLHELYLKRDNGLLSCFDIEYSKLEKAANTHAAQLLIDRYLKVTSQKDKQALAHEILSHKASFKLIYQNPELTLKTLQQQSHLYLHQQQLRNLSSTQRRDYQFVCQYHKARQDAGVAWSNLFGAQERYEVPHRAQINLCYGLNRTRNALAYQIALTPEAYAPYLKHFKIKLKDIKKHALNYRAYLERQQAPSKIRNTTRTKPQASSITPPKPMMVVDGKPVFSRAVVDEALMRQGTEFYETVLGAKGKPSGQGLRYGAKGSLSVSLRGSSAGLWHSFETGEHGGPVSLLMNSEHGWGLSYADAIKEGARLARLTAHDATFIQPPQKPEPQPQLEEAQALQNRIASARYYYLSAKPIEGTLGEIYLRKARGLSGDLSAFRYHDHIRDTRTVTSNTGETQRHTHYYPGVVVAAQNAQGEITATQTILLDRQTGNKIDKSLVDVVKRSRGQLKGSAVLIHTGDSNQVIIAEGPETAGSFIEAAPNANIYVTLGNIKNAASLGWLADKHDTRTFYFAADQDENPSNIKALHEVAKTLKETHNIDAYMALPHLDGHKKCDFNDVLQQKGIETVKQQFNTLTHITPKPPLPVLDEAQLTQQIDSGLAQVLTPPKQTQTQNFNPTPAHDALGLSFSKLLTQHPEEWQKLERFKDKNVHWVMKFRHLSQEKTELNATIKAERSALEYFEKFIKSTNIETLKTEVPNIAHFATQQFQAVPQKAKHQRIDWLSQAYEKEWQALSQYKHVNARWMIKFYELAKTKTCPKDIDKALVSLEKEAKKLARSSMALEGFIRFAPKLGETLQNFSHGKYHKKSQDFDR